jgi:uncharacterized protein (DUF1800 family)
LASSIVDAFWRFLSLFTSNGGSKPWSTGLVEFNQNVLSAEGAAAVPPDVVRLAKQATFGPTPQVVSRIAQLGMAGWIDEQFTLRGSSYNDLVTWVPRNYCDTQSDPKCWQNNFSRYPVAARFYANAVLAPDQLRQRIAFALSQILVVSSASVNGTGGLASYQQIFLDNAFGNYSDILNQVTLHGYMGVYLSMGASSRWGPSENYARELLQIFTMGPNKLSMDGQEMTDSAGRSIPNYSSDDIAQISKALTGWTFALRGGRTDWTGFDLSQPMITRPGHYDPGPKSFLGATVPSGASQQDSVRAVVKAAFDNPSTPPRISKLLIQHLVKANPSPGYVQRVSQTFADNGRGVRGDLKAVVRAILLDAEARGDESHMSDSGKVKEPVLAMVSLARLIGLRTDGASFVNRDAALGQPVFQAPSVFNFYQATNPLRGSSSLVSPASQLQTAGSVTAMQNLMFDWTLKGEASRSDWNYDWGIPNFTGTAPNWQGWQAIATDVDRLVAVINLLALNNSATPSQISALKTAAMSITNADKAVEARRRTQALLYVAASSPNFIVDR